MANQQSNKSSSLAIIIVIIVILLAGGGAGWYFLKYKPDMEAKEKARLEQLAKEEADRKAAELEAQKQMKFDDLISEADEAFESEGWDLALSIYMEASDLYPGKAYPQDQIALINAKLEELAAIEAARPGTIEMVSSATGRYYVILSSSIDDDLAMDFAKKLAKEKVNIKILETHAENLTYFAVSPGDYDTYADAEAAISDFSQYSSGTEIWVLRY